MAANLLASNTFAFNDGNAGHVCNLGSAPAVGDLDVLCVNSNTVVSTPAGFTANPSSVGGQGAYIFYRFAVGGEAATVTITTTGDHNTTVVWSRWDNCIAVDVGAATQASAPGNSTPAHSSGILSDTGELVIAFGAIHGIGVADQNTPVWAGGFTDLATAGPQGTGSQGTLAYTGYRTDAGTAAVSPQVSWSGAAAEDRYMLTLSFTATDTVSVTGDAAVTVSMTGDAVAVSQLEGQANVTVDLTSTLGSNPDSFSFVSQLSAALLNCLCAAITGMPEPPQHCCYRVGTEPVHDISLEQIDLCCEGLAYVLLGDVYPSSESFPDNDIVRQIQGGCAWPAWAVAFRIGIVGCVPGDSDCDRNNAAFMTNLHRMQAINTAVCCFRDFLRNSDTFFGFNLVIERQTQGSTSGLCTERYVNLVAQIPNLDCSCG